MIEQRLGTQLEGQEILRLIRGTRRNCRLAQMAQDRYRSMLAHSVFDVAFPIVIEENLFHLIPDYHCEDERSHDSIVIM